MDNETHESESTGGSSSYQGNPVMFIVHTRHGYMFGSRSDTVLKRVCGADSKASRAQVKCANEYIIASLVSEFEQAFSTNTEIAFTGHNYKCKDIEKIEILDGNSVCKNCVLATVINPNI